MKINSKIFLQPKKSSQALIIRITSFLSRKNQNDMALIAKKRSQIDTLLVKALKRSLSMMSIDILRQSIREKILLSTSSSISERKAMKNKQKTW